MTNHARSRAVPMFRSCPEDKPRLCLWLADRPKEEDAAARAVASIAGPSQARVAYCDDGARSPGYVPSFQLQVGVLSVFGGESPLGAESQLSRPREQAASNRSRLLEHRWAGSITRRKSHGEPAFPEISGEAGQRNRALQAAVSTSIPVPLPSLFHAVRDRPQRSPIELGDGTLESPCSWLFSAPSLRSIGLR